MRILVSVLGCFLSLTAFAGPIVSQDMGQYAVGNASTAYGACYLSASGCIQTDQQSCEAAQGEFEGGPCGGE